jgi:prepilin signal peptidase PulO-like enzyme (type II secretory pathway)
LLSGGEASDTKTDLGATKTDIVPTDSVFVFTKRGRNATKRPPFFPQRKSRRRPWKYPEAFGGGDIKLMAAAGLYLGWKYTVAGVAVGLFAAGLYGIYLLIRKKAGPKSKLKLAPFLAYGLAAATLFGDLIIRLIFGWN